MARFNEEQSEQIRKERKEQILQAALAVFADHGINGTKMSMIAKAAGVSHGLMYHYFQSKEEVLHLSLQGALSITDDLIRVMLELDLSPAGKITRFTYLALHQGNRHVFHIVQRVLQGGEIDPATKQLIEDAGQKYVQLLFPLIVEGQQVGEIIEEDPEKLTFHYLTVLSGVLTEDIAEFQPDLDWHVNILMRMLLKN